MSDPQMPLTASRDPSEVFSMIRFLAGDFADQFGAERAFHYLQPYAAGGVDLTAIEEGDFAGTETLLHMLSVARHWSFEMAHNDPERSAEARLKHIRKCLAVLDMRTAAA